MNEEQSEELINVLKEIKNNLKPVTEESPTRNQITLRLLKGEFYDSLDEAQQKYLNQAIKDKISFSFNLIKGRQERKQEDL